MPEPRSALLVAHPGHELLLHGWLRATRPQVCVLTDGSGRDGESRLEATTRLLERVDAPSGVLYGRYPDRVIYEALLDGDTSFFVGLAHEIAKSLAGDGIERVVGDAAEGWNPIHDAFRLTVNAAVALAARECRRPLELYEFALFGPPHPGEAPALGFSLDSEDRAAKRAAALAYTELDREVRFSIDRYGESSYATEWLRRSDAQPGEYELRGDAPIYERYAEFLARAGQVERPIRYREHLLPVAEALGAAAGAR